MITHIFKQFLTSLIWYWFNFVLNKFYLRSKRVEYGFEQQQSDIRLHHSAALLQCAALDQLLLNILRLQSTLCTNGAKNSIPKFTRPSFVDWWFLPPQEQLYKVLPLAQLYTTTRQATPWDGSCCQATEGQREQLARIFQFSSLENTLQKILTKGRSLEIFFCVFVMLYLGLTNSGVRLAPLLRPVSIC